MSLNKDYKSSTDEQIEKMRERLREERRKAQETEGTKESISEEDRLRKILQEERRHLRRSN